MSNALSPQRTLAGEALTELILELFRVNGALIDAGNTLTGKFGLTSARWQVMGAIDLEDRALTVSQIAREMGLTRQAVQRIVNELIKDEFLQLLENPDDRRAKLVALTEKGNSTMVQVNAAQANWVNKLSEAFEPDTSKSALSLLQEIRTRLAP